MMASSTKLKEKEKTNGTEKKERKNPKKKRERKERNKTVILWRQSGPWKAPTQDKKALDITILEITKSNIKENSFFAMETSCLCYRKFEEYHFSSVHELSSPFKQ
jgi:hypothetical protein